jgi:two-component system, OmpR family, sensor histidine kinase BaeS
MMRTLRGRLMLAMVLASVVVAGVILAAVQWFSTEQIAELLMEGVESPAEADAMVDEYIGRVVAIGAIAGVALGWIAAWWLIRRVLRPLERLTDGTRRIAAGDLTARMPEPPDLELRQVAQAFNRMAATLERVDRLRTALVEDVAHELRTPLSSLRGYTEALADGIIEPTPEMLRTIHSEIERLTRLVEGLDALARSEAPVNDRARAEVDLGEVVHRALSLVAPELATRSIEVRIDQSPDPATLFADPDGIRQVVANLVQNAARYTTDGGQISVRIGQDGPSIRCAITNSGPEIPEKELPLIWERLHRVDRSRTRKTGGAGIGLTIVRQIVEAHGGDVGAASRSGWTEIWFRLPTPDASVERVGYSR